MNTGSNSRKNTQTAAILAVAAVIGAVVLASQAFATLPEGTTVVPDPNPDANNIVSFIVKSPYQKGPNKLEVLLPDKLDPRKQYPVVYCLPVNVGTKGQWGHPLQEAAKYDLANKYQVIFVCPAYEILPWYGDNPQRPEVRQNQYVLEVVIPFIDSKYPTIADGRGRYLIGFSKSAIGALSLLLRDMDKFAKAAVFENFWGEPDAKQWATWGFIDCYGTRENFDNYDPQHLIDVHKKELAEGPLRIVVLNGGPGVRVGVESLVMILRDRKIPHLYIYGNQMSHTWTSGWLPLAVAGMDPTDKKTE